MNNSTEHDVPRVLGFIEGDVVDEKGVTIIPESAGLSMAMINRIMNCYNVCSGIPDDRLGKVMLAGEAMWEAAQQARTAAVIVDATGFSIGGFWDVITAWLGKGRAK